MIKLRVSCETEAEKEKIIKALTKENTIKKISKPIKAYSKGKALYRFYVDIN